MLSKAKIKFIRSLQLKKSREKYASVLAEGSKIVGELINERPNLVAGIYASNDWIASNQQLLKDPDCEVVAIDGREMKQIYALQKP